MSPDPVHTHTHTHTHTHEHTYTPAHVGQTRECYGTMSPGIVPGSEKRAGFVHSAQCTSAPPVRFVHLLLLQLK